MSKELKLIVFCKLQSTQMCICPVLERGKKVIQLFYFLQVLYSEHSQGCCFRVANCMISCKRQTFPPDFQDSFPNVVWFPVPGMKGPPSQRPQAGCRSIDVYNLHWYATVLRSVPVMFDVADMSMYYELCILLRNGILHSTAFAALPLRSSPGTPL